MKKFMQITLVAVAALVGAAGAASAGDMKSLRGEVAIDEADAAPQVYETMEGSRFSPNFRQQPPLIPHKVDKYEIDLKVNQCLRCHDWPYNVQENAPKVSETHYVSREGQRLDKIAGTRWFCTSCHVSQAKTEALVKNNFQSAK